MRGPTRSQSQAEAEQIQKGHLAYMADLHRQGKLIMAGPFLDQSDWRGVVVYRVGSVAEAKGLAAGDPAGEGRPSGHRCATVEDMEGEY